MEQTKKIVSPSYPDITLKVIPGHFVTPNSHVNYYLDMSTLKSRQNEAEAVARAMADSYSSTVTVDTIVCLEGCEVIGAYLANELTKAGVLSINAHKTMYIVTPEYNTNGMIIFRENTTPMIKNKNVLLILPSATTGISINTAIEAVRYYGGTVSGVSAIFSAARNVGQIPIHSIFSTVDLPDYKIYTSDNCPLCKSGVPVDAMANGFGYSRI